MREASRAAAVVLMSALMGQPGGAQPTYPEAADQSSELIFRSGFEPDTRGSPADEYRMIIGTDHSVGAPNDWVDHLIGHPKIGNFTLYYEGGSIEDRYARIVDDPSRHGNKALHFWMKNARIPTGNGQYKGRIQTSIYETDGLNAFYYKFRWYIHPDIRKLESSPNGALIAFAEYWNEPNWTGSAYPFRTTVRLRKDSGAGRPLYFSVRSDVEAGNWTPVWSVDNRDFEIPYGKWMTVEIYYKQGDASDGRLYMAVAPEGGEKQVIFALSALTHHPDNPSPRTVWLNPFKMYCPEAPINHIRESGGVMQWYFDDFELWDGFPGAGPDVAWRSVPTGS